MEFSIFGRQDKIPQFRCKNEPARKRAAALIANSNISYLRRYGEDFITRRPSIELMSLNENGGITYQYYEGEVLWPFGFGLSYTKWELSWEDEDEFAVNVKNIGSVESDVVVLAYGSYDGESDDVVRPLRQLCGFCRIGAVGVGEEGTCDLEINTDVLQGSGDNSNFKLVVELGDGTAIEGKLIV